MAMVPQPSASALVRWTLTRPARLPVYRRHQRYRLRRTRPGTSGCSRGGWHAGGVSRPVPRFLLTGTPGAGKTTLVSCLAERLLASGIPVTGFVVREVREAGRRTGFTAEAFGGPRALIAHVSWKTGPQVGRYRVDVAAFEQVALPAVGKAIRQGGVTVIDELGQMELFSGAFVREVQLLFDHGGPLVAAAHLRSHPVTDALKRRPDVELLEVRPDNRDALLAQLTASFLGEGRSGPSAWSPGGLRQAP